jgi:hypothetical protein
MPCISPEDAITIAADDLLQALMNPKILEGNLNLQSKHYEALKQIAQLFNTASKAKPMILKPPIPGIMGADTSERKQLHNSVPEKSQPSNIKKQHTEENDHKNLPNVIPFDDDSDQKFSRHTYRPPIHRYNTRNKHRPHVIPLSNNLVQHKTNMSSNIVNDQHKKMSYRKLIHSNFKKK